MQPNTKVQPDAAVEARSLYRWPTYIFGVLHRDFHQRLDSTLREHWVLAVLAENDNLSQQDVCNTLSVDRSEMVRHVDRLESGGLVTRERSDSDRRRYNLRITKKGRAQIAVTEARCVGVTAETLGRLTESERRTLHRLALKAIGQPESYADPDRG